MSKVQGSLVSKPGLSLNYTDSYRYMNVISVNKSSSVRQLLYIGTGSVKSVVGLSVTESLPKRNELNKVCEFKSRVW